MSLKDLLSLNYSTRPTVILPDPKFSQPSEFAKSKFREVEVYHNNGSFRDFQVNFIDQAIVRIREKGLTPTKIIMGPSTLMRLQQIYEVFIGTAYMEGGDPAAQIFLALIAASVKDGIWTSYRAVPIELDRKIPKDILSWTYVCVGDDFAVEIRDLR